MPDTFQRLTQQLAGKIEVTPGTEETLTAAEVKLRPFQDFGFDPDFRRFSNDQVAEDIGQAPDFVSGTAGGLSVGFPLHGPGDLTSAPAAGVYLRGCGLKEEDVQQITIDAPAGNDNAFLAGDAWTSGAKSGIVESDISAGGQFRYVLDGGSADLADTDVISSDGDTATASGSPSDYATKYTPRSTSHETLTIQRGVKNFNETAGQDFLWRLKGALGNFRIEFAALDAIRFLSEFSGVLAFKGAGSLFTGVTIESLSNADLPKLINSTIQLNGVTVRPSAITFDAGNTVELDPNPTTGGGTEGFDLAQISDRTPTLSIDPFKLKPGDLDDLGLLEAGTEIPISIICGTTPNIFEFTALKAQVREDSEGDRSGRVVSNLTLNIVRNSLTDNDYAIYFR